MCPGLARGERARAFRSRAGAARRGPRARRASGLRRSRLVVIRAARPIRRPPHLYPRQAGITSDALASAAVGATNVAGTLIATGLIERAGRKQLLLQSYLGMAAAMLIMAAGFVLPALQNYAGGCYVCAWRRAGRLGGCPRTGGGRVWRRRRLGVRPASLRRARAAAAACAGPASVAARAPRPAPNHFTNPKHQPQLSNLPSKHHNTHRPQA